MRSVDDLQATYGRTRDRDALNSIARDAGIKGGQGRTPDELERSGSLAATVLVIVACVLLAVVIGGCGTVAGLGDDLRQWSDGIRGNVAKEGGDA